MYEAQTLVCAVQCCVGCLPVSNCTTATKDDYCCGVPGQGDMANLGMNVYSKQSTCWQRLVSHGNYRASDWILANMVSIACPTKVARETLTHTLSTESALPSSLVDSKTSLRLFICNSAILRNYFAIERCMVIVLVPLLQLRPMRKVERSNWTAQYMYLACSVIASGTRPEFIYESPGPIPTWSACFAAARSRRCILRIESFLIGEFGVFEVSGWK